MIYEFVEISISISNQIMRHAKVMYGDSGSLKRVRILTIISTPAPLQSALDGDCVCQTSNSCSCCCHCCQRYQQLLPVCTLCRLLWRHSTTTIAITNYIFIFRQTANQSSVQTDRTDLLVMPMPMQWLSVCLSRAPSNQAAGPTPIPSTPLFIRLSQSYKSEGYLNFRLLPW